MHLFSTCKNLSVSICSKLKQFSNVLLNRTKWCGCCTAIGVKIRSYWSKTFFFLKKNTVVWELQKSPEGKFVLVWRNYGISMRGGINFAISFYICVCVLPIQMCNLHTCIFLHRLEIDLIPKNSQYRLVIIISSNLKTGPW